MAIANRGEIALRIVRACKALGIPSVVLYSQADRDSLAVSLADESLCIGPAAAADSYLNSDAIISAATISGAQSIHPGYGFLAENAIFAERVEAAGFTFIGPSPSTLALMADKISALTTMTQAGVPTLPGSAGALPLDQPDQCLAVAAGIGYPVIIKAAAGGGGRGMRVVDDAAKLIHSIHVTRAEAAAAFGDGRVYLEKYLTHPRHVEVQILGDGQGSAIHLFSRDCSLQRRQQKVLEEAPAPDIAEAESTTLYRVCVEAAIAMNYRGAGTFEFLYQDQQFYFIEMNTRIQVEHPVTEMITGIDLVGEQINLCSGAPLTLQQSDIKLRGHALECRINAEDAITMLPSPGTVTRFQAPGGPGVRVDSHLFSGCQVPPHYDSLIAKIICWSDDRVITLERMVCALEETVIEGIDCNIALHLSVLKDREIRRGAVTIHYLEDRLKAVAEYSH